MSEDMTRLWKLREGTNIVQPGRISEACFRWLAPPLGYTTKARFLCAL